MSQEIVRQFESAEFGTVRTAVAENGNPIFCAKDVAIALGYTNTRDAIRKHCKGVAIRYPLSTGGGMQDVRFITEGDMYRLIASSKLESAQRFESWVFDEVLPAIRQDGGYMVARDETPEQTMARAVLIAQQTIERQNKQIEEMRPKAVFADAVSVSKTTILVGDLAKILKQNGFDIGANRLFALLGEQGYLCKQRGAMWNMPTQRSMEMGLFVVKETTVTHSDGHSTISKTPKVTGKGQVYFVNKFCNGHE